jgi:hypothetical protein
MLLRGGLLAAAIMGAAPPALACSCACDPEDPTHLLDNAAYIFKGKVLSVETHGTFGADGFEVIRMSVSKVVKGNPGPDIFLYSWIRGRGSCGVGYRRGESYNTMAVRGDDGRLWTDACIRQCATRSGAFKSLESDK